MDRVDIGHLIAHLATVDNRLYQALVTLADAPLNQITNISNTNVSTGLVTYTLSREFTLSLDSDACPRVPIITGGNCTYLKATLKVKAIAGTVGDVTCDIYQDTELWQRVTFAEGEDVVVIDVETAGLSPIVQDNFWRVDITSVGDVFPGAGLQITIGQV